MTTLSGLSRFALLYLVLLPLLLTGFAVDADARTETWTNQRFEWQGDFDSRSAGTYRQYS
jgi:hypothetical protein